MYFVCKWKISEHHLNSVHILWRHTCLMKLSIDCSLLNQYNKSAVLKKILKCSTHREFTHKYNIWIINHETKSLILITKIIIPSKCFEKKSLKTEECITLNWEFRKKELKTLKVLKQVRIYHLWCKFQNSRI